MSAPVTCRYGDTVVGGDLEKLRTVVHGLGGGDLHQHLVPPSHRSKAGDAEMVDGEMAPLELAKASGDEIWTGGCAFSGPSPPRYSIFLPDSYIPFFSL